MPRNRTSRRRQITKAPAVIKASPYIKRKIPIYEILNDDALTIIENNADTILAEVGIILENCTHAIDLLTKAGAKAEGDLVKFPKGMLREIIQKTAPSEFVQYARNQEKNVVIGGNNTVLVPVGGPPFVQSLKEGRRYAQISDFENFVKLAYMSDNVHHSGGNIVEPMDLKVSFRHLNMVYSHIKYSDKAIMGSFSAPSRAQDSMNMAKIVWGEEFFDNNCVLIGIMNSNSPLRWDIAMLDSARVYAENNQASIITPFIISGAMGPVTAASVAAQSLAEAMVAMAYTQLVRPGAPVVYGSFATSMSMQNGGPTFGTPEAAHAMNISAALSRRLGVPFRSGGGFTTSKIPDAQAGYEAANTLQQTILSGVNFSMQAIGWLEGGLAAGYEKFIMDADQAGMARVFAEGVDMSENGQAMEAYKQVNPGDHFLGCAHTEKNFKTAFYQSDIADNNSYEQWKDEGSLDMAKRAEAKYQKMLKEYEAPPIDVAIDEALLDYIKKRVTELED